jgi:hypothetical protein
MLPDTSQREELRMQQSPQARDLLGYAGSPPHPHWPGGARVAVSIVVNFEEGAEFSVTDGDAENEAVLRNHWATQPGN